MNRRETRKALQDIKDWIGYRIVIPGLWAFESAEAAVRAVTHPSITIGARQDKIAEPNESGYTGAVHYDIEVDGVPGEVQIRPPIIDRVANWEHETIYKSWKSNPEMHKWIEDNKTTVVTPYVRTLYLWAMMRETDLRAQCHRPAPRRLCAAGN